jgi:hypothetical protein
MFAAVILTILLRCAAVSPGLRRSTLQFCCAALLALQFCCAALLALQFCCAALLA